VPLHWPDAAMTQLCPGYSADGCEARVEIEKAPGDRAGAFSFALLRIYAPSWIETQGIAPGG